MGADGLSAGMRIFHIAQPVGKAYNPAQRIGAIERRKMWPTS